jgi:serine/threonine-protein kinase
MEPDDSLPRLLGGRYRLEAKLGHGGMGVVYRATDLTMHRPVAVKLIRGSDGVELDEDVAGRFLREAKNTARIQHEHIIEVYDLGRSEDGDLFFVMELLEGESLSARLRRIGRFTATQTVNIARQICEALQVAHTAGIIHRDLKPANVMLVRRAGEDDFVKVLDFGVAKSYSPDQQTQLTHTGMLVGTVEYMAPEQIMGKPVDGRSDVYSLGIVLYRMLAGKAPFKDGGVPALIHAHLNVRPKPISDAAPDVPVALESVILTALAKTPEDRYPSMADFGDALANSLEPTINQVRPGLLDLEYGGGGDDPYEMGDKTEVGRRPASDPALLAEDDLTVKGSSASFGFDDATVKMDRPSQASSASSIPKSPAQAPNIFLQDETALLRADESTAKRSIPEEIARRERAEARPCAMCQTMNPPHARACNACGISLAAEDQAAVRARVSAPAPRTAHMNAPQMPPPISGQYQANHASQNFRPATPPQGIYATPPHGISHAPPPAWGSRPPPGKPPSVWQRFLGALGLARR